jgi:hypothetical protein
MNISIYNYGCMYAQNQSQNLLFLIFNPVNENLDLWLTFNQKVRAGRWSVEECMYIVSEVDACKYHVHMIPSGSLT